MIGTVQRRGPWVAVVAGVVALIAVGVLLVRPGPAPRADAVVIGTVGTTASPGPTGYTGSTGPLAAERRRASPRPAEAGSPRPSVSPLLAPSSLAIPALQVAGAPVVPVVARSDGALDIPDDPRTVGWYAAGARLGSEQGTVLLVGHVDSKELGLGVLAPLRTLAPGASIRVAAAGGERTSWVVDAVRQYPKSALPREVFTRFGTSRLALVTCGGAFDARTGHYEDNVVVYATPA